MRGSQLGGHRQLSCNSDQRILGRLIAIGGREVGGPLDVRVVVGAAGGGADESDAQLAEHVEQGVGLGEVDAEPGVVTAEREPIRVGRLGSTDSPVARDVRHQIERRQPHRDRQAGGAVAYATDHGSEERCAPTQVTTEATLPVVAAEEFVEQVTVAVLDVDEVETRLLCEHGGRDVPLGQLVEFIVAEHRLRVDADSRVEHRVGVGGPRQRRATGTRPATRVGELQAAHLRGIEQLAELGDLVDSSLVEDQLIRVGTTVGAHRRGLSPHEPTTARCESAPPASNEIGRATIGGAVPALHRQHGEPIRCRQRSCCPVADHNGIGEHTARVDHVVDRDLDAEVGTVLAELIDRAQLLDLGVPNAHRPLDVTSGVRHQT